MSDLTKRNSQAMLQSAKEMERRMVRLEEKIEQLASVLYQAQSHISKLESLVSTFAALGRGSGPTSR